MEVTGRVDLGAGQAGCRSHRSHFGSRYKLGCCGHAGLFGRGFEPGEVQSHSPDVTSGAWLDTVVADGHTASNAPDLFRPPKLSGAGPGQYWGGGPPGKTLGCCQLFGLFARLLPTSPIVLHAAAISAWQCLPSQRSLHNAPIFRLLLKVAVNGTHQCDFLNFCGGLGPQHLTVVFV